MKENKIFILLLFLFIITNYAFAQEADIVPYLKQIEAGNKKAVVDKLPQLKKENPNSSSILFLEAVVTENAQDAIGIYNKILKNYPGGKYADASLYRLFSYYYSLGLYETSKAYLLRLKNEYPNSPYIKIAERNIPTKNDSTAEVDSKKNELPDEVVNKKEPEKVEPTEPEQKFKYTIQAGAFGQSANAQSLKKQFNDAGYNSEITEKDVAGTTFHIVYVGKFQTEDEAKSFLQVINSGFNLQGRIVSLDSE